MPEQNKYKIYIYLVLIAAALAAGYWYWKSRQKAAPKELTPQQIINNLTAPATTTPPVGPKTLKSLSAPIKTAPAKSSVSPNQTQNIISAPEKTVPESVINSLTAPSK